MSSNKDNKKKILRFCYTFRVHGQTITTQKAGGHWDATGNPAMVHVPRHWTLCYLVIRRPPLSRILCFLSLSQCWASHRLTLHVNPLYGFPPLHLDLRDYFCARARAIWSTSGADWLHDTFYTVSNDNKTLQETFTIFFFPESNCKCSVPVNKLKSWNWIGLWIWGCVETYMVVSFMSTKH